MTTEAALRRARALIYKIKSNQTAVVIDMNDHLEADELYDLLGKDLESLLVPAADGVVTMARIEDAISHLQNDTTNEAQDVFAKINADAAEKSRAELLGLIRQYAAQQAQQSDSGWLIEWHFHGEIHYVVPTRFGEDFAEFVEVDGALRFVRKEDAERVADYLRRQMRYRHYEFKVNEHLWPVMDTENKREKGKS